jgi:predicted DNA-binding protein
MVKKPVTYGIRLDDQTANYIQALADALDLPKTYIVRELIKVAIELHKNRVLEFPELTINKEALKKLVEEKSIGTTDS